MLNSLFEKKASNIYWSHLILWTHQGRTLLIIQITMQTEKACSCKSTFWRVFSPFTSVIYCLSRRHTKEQRWSDCTLFLVFIFWASPDKYDIHSIFSEVKVQLLYTCPLFHSSLSHILRIQALVNNTDVHYSLIWVFIIGMCPKTLFLKVHFMFNSKAILSGMNIQHWFSESHQAVVLYTRTYKWC